jgi:hypothetical protein
MSAKIQARDGRWSDARKAIRINIRLQMRMLVNEGRM